MVRRNENHKRNNLKDNYNKTKRQQPLQGRSLKIKNKNCKLIRNSKKIDHNNKMSLLQIKNVLLLK